LLIASGCKILVYEHVLEKGFMSPMVTYEGHKDHITSLAIAPDGKTALSGSVDKTVHLWNVETGKRIAIFDEDFGGPISALAFSLDRHFIGIGSEDQRVQVRDAMEHNVLFTYQHNGAVNDLDFSYDSQFIASAGDDAVLIYGMDGNLRYPYTKHNGSVSTVKWIPPKAHLGPGQWVISSSGHEVKVWRGR
jgi:WD40 repeat protein